MDVSVFGHCRLGACRKCSACNVFLKIFYCEYDPKNQIIGIQQKFLSQDSWKLWHLWKYRRKNWRVHCIFYLCVLQVRKAELAIVHLLCHHHLDRVHEFPGYLLPKIDLAYLFEIINKSFHLWHLILLSFFYYYYYCYYLWLNFQKNSFKFKYWMILIFMVEFYYYLIYFLIDDLIYWFILNIQV